VSEPVGGGGPAQGSQLKNLKSHKASLNGEATLYNTNTLESLTASFSTKTEVEVSSDSVAPTYHQRTNNYGFTTVRTSQYLDMAGRKRVWKDTS
jgi:hypothetical protein